MDGKGERKRKSFSSTTKAEVTKKMTDYVAVFNEESQDSDESRKTLRESMTHWLQVFKFPSVERTTYDRCESPFMANTVRDHISCNHMWKKSNQ